MKREPGWESDGSRHCGELAARCLLGGLHLLHTCWAAWGCSLTSLNSSFLKPLPKAVLRIKGDIHRGGQNIFVFMSFAKRLGLTDHVLPKLAQCLALLEARRELLSGLSLSVLMASPCP